MTNSAYEATNSDMERLINSEIADFFAGIGQPGEPETPQEMQQQLQSRISAIFNAAPNGMMQLSNELAEMKYGDGLTSAASDVLGERHRQISEKGWSTSRDDNYVHRQLMWAAVTYCFSSANDRKYAERFWPWDNDWFKPTDERRDLVKAGALIIAEIERIDRASGGTVEGE